MNFLARLETLPAQVDEALECYIDIEAFARDQQYDYESIDFDGVDYWYRDC